jgi:hypothetical protein
MKRTITAILALALASHAAVAHHGWGSYDAAKPVTVTGPVVTLEFVNPHVSVTVKDGEKVWTLTLAPTSRMINRGALAEMVAVGKLVVAFGYPLTATPGEMRAERITVDGKTVELR